MLYASTATLRSLLAAGQGASWVPVARVAGVSNVLLKKWARSSWAWALLAGGRLVPKARPGPNTPAYPPFAPTIREYGRRVVDVPLLRTAHGWELDLAGLERAFRTGRRGYLLCNPHNPTGRDLSRAELERIAALAQRYDIVVVADENHAPLTLPGAVHTPFLSP